MVSVTSCQLDQNQVPASLYRNPRRVPAIVNMCRPLNYPVDFERQSLRVPEVARF